MKSSIRWLNLKRLMKMAKKRICIRTDKLTDDEVNELKDTISDFGEEIRSRREESASESESEAG